MPVPTSHKEKGAMAGADLCEFDDSDTCTVEDDFFDAIFKNDLDTATMLATVGEVDLNATNIQHKTPLFIAIEHENIPMVQMLINFGADIDKPSYCGTQCYFETPVVTAARMERMDIVDMLLDQQCELEGTGLKEGKSAFQWAASYGDITMAKVLLHKGADINWIGPYFQTALHYAAQGDHPDMVKWLLEKGAEIGVNGDGRSPLHIAAVRGNNLVVKHLIKHKCELDTIDKFNFSPFSLACLRGHFSVIKHFMDNSSPGTDLNLNDGLLRAAECGYLDVIEYLLNHNADVNALNSLGESPLAIAARGQFISVQLLLQNGAKVNNVDNRGYTPLQHAVLREQIDIATTLIRHGAYLHTYCTTVDSPLQMSVLVANARLVKCLLEAGCRLSHEKWFSPRIILEKLQELDFSCSIRWHRGVNSQKEIWNWVVEKVKRPQSLLEASRVAVRDQLIVACSDKSILPSIELLPLPKQLKKYLALVDDLWG